MSAALYLILAALVLLLALGVWDASRSRKEGEDE